MSLTRKLLDVVQAHESVTPYEDFADAAFSVLALALSTLPPHEREARLVDVEDLGVLRQAVRKFPSARSSPYPRAGNGHAA